MLVCNVTLVRHATQPSTTTTSTPLHSILLYTGTVSPALAQNVGIRRKLWSVGTLYIEVIRRYVAARPDLQGQMTVITVVSWVSLGSSVEFVVSFNGLIGMLNVSNS